MMGCFGGSASKNDAEEDKRRKEANKRIEKQIQKDKQIYRATHRLLLLGMADQFLMLCCLFLSQPLNPVLNCCVLFCRLLVLLLNHMFSQVFDPNFVLFFSYFLF